MLFLDMFLYAATLQSLSSVASLKSSKSGGWRSSPHPRTMAVKQKNGIAKPAGFLKNDCATMLLTKPNGQEDRAVIRGYVQKSCVKEINIVPREYCQSALDGKGLQGDARV